ncbi:hypothetical protein ACRAWF_03075 [Streptomyces sp. L7]
MLPLREDAREHHLVQWEKRWAEPVAAQPRHGGGASHPDNKDSPAAGPGGQRRPRRGSRLPQPQGRPRPHPGRATHVSCGTRLCPPEGEEETVGTPLLRAP